MVEKTRHSPRTLPHSHRARSHTSRKSKISAGIPPAYKCPAENVEVPEERISRAHFNKLAEMLLDENNPRHGLPAAPFVGANRLQRRFCQKNRNPQATISHVLDEPSKIVSL